MRSSRAFTLVELLIVIAIMAALLAVLLPALASARHQARTMRCLTNLRGLATAHWMYMLDHDGMMVDVGLGHEGEHHHEEVAWLHTLSRYYGGNRLLARSPLDDSPHWGPHPHGAPIPGEDPHHRRETSYGLNNFLIDPGNGRNPWGNGEGAYNDLDGVPNPSGTVLFLIMAFEGPFAGADHPHVEQWLTHPDPPTAAQTQSEIDAHRGPPARWTSMTNWGFLDGHATTAAFEDVLQSPRRNSFNPVAAQ